MKKFNLAVFNTQPPHLYFGGVERRIVETAKTLRNQVDMTVYSGTKAGFRKPALFKDVCIVPCFSTDALFPVDNWFFNNTLAGAVETINADVYEAHSASGYGFLRALRKKGITKPFIQTVHGVLADEYVQATQVGFLTFRAKLANFFMWQLSKLEEEAAKHSTLTVTISKYSARKIREFYNIKKKQIRVAPNGVDTQTFKPSKTRATIKRQIGIDNKLCVLFVGRLILRKGLTYLIEAARLIVKDHRQTLFLIVGDGPLKKHMLSHIKEAKLANNFVFLGDVSEKLLPSLYNCADVFVLPSIQEGQGIALLEAQATAIPVVAFNVGGVSEAVLDKETGLLTKPSPNKLAEAIQELLASKSLRDKMGSNGRKFVEENFSWEMCAQKMMQVYQEALASVP